MSTSKAVGADFLVKLPLFKGISDAGLERLARGLDELDVGSGSTLFRRGQPASGMHIVVDGQVKLALRTGNGDERVMELAGKGQTFGEAAMFLGRPYISDAETVVKSTLLHIDRNTLLAEIQRDPELSNRMIANLSDRLYRHVENLEICMLSSGVRRVIRYLLKHDNEERLDSALHFTLPTKKGIIASSLNLTQEHFSRILHALAKEDLIRVDGRQICILDVDRMVTYSTD